MNWNFFPPATLPAPLDIVWCRFPHHADLGNPGPYARPALVKNASVDDEGRGEVQLVYGTTTLKLGTRKNDFFITKQAEMDYCGLWRATRFDLDCIAWIPWADEWFETLQGYSSPVIGHLSPHSTKMLEVTIAIKQYAAIKAAAAKGE